MTRWHSSYLVLFGILAFALILRLHYYIGIGVTDDVEYTRTAQHAASGHPFYFDFLTSQSNGQIRFMSIFPVAVCFKLLGYKVSSANVYFLFCSLGAMVLVYLIGKRLFDDSVGLLAAFLYSIFPLDVYYSTQISGDIVVPFYMLLGIYLLVKERPFAAGVVWGICLNAKENGIFFIPFLAAYLLSCWKSGPIENPEERFPTANRQPFQILKSVLSGFSLIFVMELFLFYSMTGNPFYRLKIDHWINAHIGTQTSLTIYPSYIFHLFPTHFDENRQGGLFGFFPLLLPFLIWISLWKGDASNKRKVLFLALSILFIAAYLEFGIMTLAFRPIAKWPRYCTILIGPTVLLTAYGISRIHRFFQIGLVCLFCAYNLWDIQMMVHTTTTQLKVFQEAYQILNAIAPKTIYAPPDYLGRLDPLFRGERKIVYFDERVPDERYSDAYVILRPRDFNARSKERVTNKFWKRIAYLDPALPAMAERLSPCIYYIPHHNPEKCN